MDPGSMCAKEWAARITLTPQLALRSGAALPEDLDAGCKLAEGCEHLDAPHSR